MPETWMETARVWGETTSEGEREEQRRKPDDPRGGVSCPHLDDCNTRYAGITWIEFSKPTVDPRPINITMGGELLQVSLGPDNVFTAEAVVRNHFTHQKGIPVESMKVDCGGTLIGAGTIRKDLKTAVSPVKGVPTMKNSRAGCSSYHSLDQPLM